MIKPKSLKRALMLTATRWGCFLYASSTLLVFSLTLKPLIKFVGNRGWQNYRRSKFGSVRNEDGRAADGAKGGVQLQRLLISLFGHGAPPIRGAPCSERWREWTDDRPCVFTLRHSWIPVLPLNGPFRHGVNEKWEIRRWRQAGVVETSEVNLVYAGVAFAAFAACLWLEYLRVGTISY